MLQDYKDCGQKNKKMPKKTVENQVLAKLAFDLPYEDYNLFVILHRRSHSPIFGSGKQVKSLAKVEFKIFSHFLVSCHEIDSGLHQ